MAQQSHREIIIEINNLNNADIPEVQYHKINFVGTVEWQTLLPVRSGKKNSYLIPVKEPVALKIKNIGHFLAEPGDRVSLELVPGGVKAKGLGASKYELIDSVRKIKISFKKPANISKNITKSEADYLEWHEYLTNQIMLTIPLIDSYRNKLSVFAYNYIRSTTLDSSLDAYSDKFATIWWHYSSIGITRERSLELFDSRYKPLVDKYFPYIAQHLAGTWKPLRWPIDRKYIFQDTNIDFNTKLKRKLLYLEEAKKVYQGLAREKMIFEILFDELVVEEGLVPEVEVALDVYYAESTFPEWKAYMKSEVLKVRERRNARSAPDFELIDTKAKMITKTDFKGKLVIFDYWFTGCQGCIQMASAMLKMEKEFKSDSNVVFVNLSIDKSREVWMKSIRQAKYTSGSGINVYTGGIGDQHPMVKYYGVTGYPSLVLLDGYGRAISVLPKLDPRSEQGYKRMRDFVKRQLVEMKDGPYMMNEDNKLIVYTFNGSKMGQESYEKNALKSIKTNTHELDKQFEVILKNKLIHEPALHPEAEKLLVLSDIEGNFEAFAKLLQANKVIDKDYNWIFGKGRLVFAGDMFDRGEQVTECLWMMYALEEKAITAGGYVHFVLGNHEIMNLQGDDRYHQPKYKANAEKMGKKLSEIYGEDSELGRWLRTKNIVEKIGDLLIVHGGIGLEFASAVNLPIQEINNLARRNYANGKATSSPDLNMKMIFDEKWGPLWYRNYYGEDSHYIGTKDTTLNVTVRHPSQQELEDILAKYGANRIITGHTIVADTISVLYNTRVINTDVPHAKGKSEALLIEGKCFYRVNDKGERKLLFRDPEDNTKTKK
ncbi:metallophosphoesterase [Pedobacter sp. GR22-6]|uniref:metallophosphoesterase n=1 Tax=Pedobacter sp. GR22-6 TaxID=3127957 RepID=UPI00307DAA6B